MTSKIIVAIIAALLSGETLAADPLPSAKFSELSGIPESPHQLQGVLPVSVRDIESLST